MACNFSSAGRFSRALQQGARLWIGLFCGQPPPFLICELAFFSLRASPGRPVRARQARRHGVHGSNTGLLMQQLCNAYSGAAAKRQEILLDVPGDQRCRPDMRHGNYSRSLKKARVVPQESSQAPCRGLWDVLQLVSRVLSSGTPIIFLGDGGGRGAASGEAGTFPWFDAPIFFKHRTARALWSLLWVNVSRGRSRAVRTRCSFCCRARSCNASMAPDEARLRKHKFSTLHSGQTRARQRSHAHVRQLYHGTATLSLPEPVFHRCFSEIWGRASPASFFAS